MIALIIQEEKPRLFFTLQSIQLYYRVYQKLSGRTNFYKNDLELKTPLTEELNIANRLIEYIKYDEIAYHKIECNFPLKGRTEYILEKIFEFLKENNMFRCTFK